LPERESQQIAGPDKSKRKTRRVEAAGSTFIGDVSTGRDRPTIPNGSKLSAASHYLSKSLRSAWRRRAAAIGEAFAQSGVSGQMVVRKGKDGHVFVTDGGHWIVDAHLGRIADAPRLAGLLVLIPGVVEHGLFIGLASMAILAGSEGIRVVERP